MAIVPDDKNWTWVLQRPCPDCGFDASAVELRKMGELIRGNVALWPAMLAHEHAGLRPTGDQWSAVEYGCHVRDVFRVYDARLRLMLESDAPLFQNWDRTRPRSRSGTTCSTRRPVGDGDRRLAPVRSRRG